VRRAVYAFGGRSASIWTTSGTRLWDSGDAIERRVAADLGPLAGGFFNVSNSVANEVSGTVTPYRVD
jgi:hypothetical protein